MLSGFFCVKSIRVNGSQLAKMKKYIPYMFLSENL